METQSATTKGSLEFPTQHDAFSIVDNTELPTRARAARSGSSVLSTTEKEYTTTNVNLEIQAVTAKGFI